MDDYDKKIRALFTECNRIESVIADKKMVIKDLQQEIQYEQVRYNNFWNAIADLMREAGVVEEVVETSFCKLKLYFSEPSGSVVVPDVDALPDQYKRVKTTVEPDKKAIGEYLKSGAQVNWASIDRGEPQLVCKAMNK